MREIFKSYLFQHHILVNDKSWMTVESGECLCSLVTLANKFDIRIIRGGLLANQQIIRDAAMYLGEYVPEPFYRGFPESVKKLSPEEKLFDQMYHYTLTYGMGWFEECGHSTIEELFERIAFQEKTEPKDFMILTEEEATNKVKEFVKRLLGENSRPLNEDQLFVVAAAWKEYTTDILPEKILCKRTAVEMLYRTKDQVFYRYLKLPDTIKLLEFIQFYQYGSENLKKLNLKNQDRKLITKLLDYFFEGIFGEFDPSINECFEKRKIWCGLLHHIHYKPKNRDAEMFVHDIRSGVNRSAYSRFEAYMADPEPDGRIMAAKVLAKDKGNSELVRKLNYILSRCKTEEEVKEVLKCLGE